MTVGRRAPAPDSGSPSSVPEDDGVDVLHRLELESAEAHGREPLGDAIRQLRERPLERLVVGSSGMPAVRPASLAERRRVLHERHALALDRARDERLRAIADLAERLERVTKLADVVAVTGHDVPAEGTEPGLELAERDDLVRRLVRLELVAIDDDRKARQALVRGGLEPFVVLTLLQLAVADHDDDPPAAAEVPLRPRDPAALRDAHTERARSWPRYRGLRRPDDRRAHRDGAASTAAQRGITPSPYSAA